MSKFPNYALILIDLQKAYFNNDDLKQRQADFVGHCNELLRSALVANVPIWNIRTFHEPNGATWTLNMKHDKEGYLFAGEQGVEMVDGLTLPDDVVHVAKSRDSAFYNTDLAAQLRRFGVTHLVLAGASTHTCIFQSATDAYTLDFEVIIAREAIASHAPKYDSSFLGVLQTEYRQRLAGTSETTDLFLRQE